jgi:hypothetical protein
VNVLQLELQIVGGAVADVSDNQVYHSDRMFVVLEICGNFGIRLRCPHPYGLSNQRCGKSRINDRRCHDNSRKDQVERSSV